MTATAERGPAAPDMAELLPRRRPGRVVAVAALLVAAAMVGHGLVANPAFQWDVVAEYFTASVILKGLVTTLWITACTVLIAFTVGTVMCMMRLSGNSFLAAPAWAYCWFFRSIPLLMQLLFWFNIGALYPRLSVGVPFGPEFASTSTLNLISGPVAAVIGLSLHESAYAAEIVRGGLLSVRRGQTEAAAALGLSGFRTFHRIVLPQAMPAIIPPTGNMVVSVLKATSIVSVIAVHDLLGSAQVIYNRNYLIIPLLVVATGWYLVVTSVLGVAQHLVERRFARGVA